MIALPIKKGFRRASEWPIPTDIRTYAHTQTRQKKKKRRSDPVMEQRFQTVGENPA